MGKNKAAGQFKAKGTKMGLASSKQPTKQEKDTDEEQEQEHEWEVESVVDYRAEDQRYRVHWKGFPNSSDDTWEPITNLQNASVALHKYWTSKQAALMAAGANNNSRSAGAAKAKPQTGTPTVSGGVKKRKALTTKSSTPKRS